MPRASGSVTGEALLARVQRVFETRGLTVTRKAMVGGQGFMVDNKLCCGVADGDLVLRLTGSARDAALMQPHVKPMTFGSRTLSGYVRIEPAGFATDAALATWIDRAL